MNINAAFPTKYVAAHDLNGQHVPCTIDRVAMENLGDDDNGGAEWKPIVYFAGFSKGLALNKTNAMAISNAYGPETDNWRGKGIILYPTETEFRGKATPCIRVRIPQGGVNGAAYPHVPQQPAPQPQLSAPQHYQQPAPAQHGAEGGVRF